MEGKSLIKMILILEDDPQRISRFIAALSTIDSNLKTKIWTNARNHVPRTRPFLPSAILLSLDHDLYAARLQAARLPPLPSPAPVKRGETQTSKCFALRIEFSHAHCRKGIHSIL